MQIVVYYVFLNTRWNFKNIYQEHSTLHSFRPFVIYMFFFGLKILLDVDGALRDKDIVTINPALIWDRKWKSSKEIVKIDC